MLDFFANGVAQIFWAHSNLSEMCSLTSQFLGPTPLVSMYQTEIIAESNIYFFKIVYHLFQ